MPERVSTTFYQDFAIADAFGPAAVKETYERVFNEWKDNYKYWTEVAMALNQRCWYWHTRNEDMMLLYRGLYYKADGWAKCSMNAKELFFYAEVMD